MRIRHSRAFHSKGSKFEAFHSQLTQAFFYHFPRCNLIANLKILFLSLLLLILTNCFS